MKSPQSIAGAILFCLLWSATPAVFAEGADQEKSPLTADEWQQYRELAKRIKENYVDPVDDKQLFNSCLNGMGKLDAHSEYYDAEAYKDLSGDSGAASVGLELGMKNNRPTVISAIEDTPASEAGIHKGDTLFKIDGNLIVELSLDKIVRQLRGKPGTKLLLTVKRDTAPEPITFELTRKLIKVQTVKSRMLEPGYGYIRISSFTTSTVEKFVEAMLAMDKQGGGELKGMVLDLRNNPGGRLDNALALAAAFLPRDVTLMSMRGRAQDMTSTFKNNGGDLNARDFSSLQQLPIWLQRIRLVVLVNNGSAAGVEIFAGAMQDYRRALIVGTPTFGKDSIQTFISVTPEGKQEETALKLTTDRWQTPNGRSSAPTGIAPDIFVAATADEAFQEKDNALERALDSLKRGQPPVLNQALVNELLDKFYGQSPPPPPKKTEQQVAQDALRKNALAASDAHSAKAIELWSQLLKDQPEDLQALRLRGVQYAEEGKRKLAAADNLLVIELEPNAATSWNSVCWSKILLGDFADAQPDCAKGITFDPGNLPATVNLGHTYLLHGEKDAAWAWYEKALLLVENKEELADLLADFDLFKKRGWQPQLSQAGHDWFSKQGKAWLVRKAPADRLIAKIRAAEAAKDTTTELKLRGERLNELEKILPPSHPFVINSAYALANTYLQAKQPDKALPLYLRMMDYLQGLDGNPPRGLITTINKITDTLNANEFTGKTAPALEQMLVVMEKFWGADHIGTQSLLRRLAAESVADNPARALDLGRRALSYLDAHDGSVDKKIKTTYTIIKALEKLKLQGESILYLEKMLALLNLDKKKNFESIIVVTESLAGTHGLLDHPDQALTYFKQSLEIQRNSTTGTLNYEYISTLNKTGGMLDHFNRLDAATPYFEEALRISEQLYGKENLITKQMSTKLDEHKLKLEKRGQH